MTDIWLAVIVVLLCIIVAVLVPTLLSLRRAARDLSAFIGRTEGDLALTMKSLRELSSAASGITADVKGFSSAVAEVGEDVRTAGRILRRLTHRAEGRISAIRIGLLTALDVFIRKAFVGNKGGES